MQNKLHSIRFFLIAFIEDNSISTHFETLENILDMTPGNNNNDCEYRYAMQDNIDNILDLKVGERLLMKFNRDNPDSEGYIKRVERK